MKVNTLETHDRLKHFLKDQEDAVYEGLIECLKNNSLSKFLQEHSPYIYIFGHYRTPDYGWDRRLVWQPRLSKPAAQPNTFLFRFQSLTENYDVCWVIPQPEMWDQYAKGKVTESDAIQRSIHNFIHHRKELESPHPEDCSEETFRNIYSKLKPQSASLIGK